MKKIRKEFNRKEFKLNKKLPFIVLALFNAIIILALMVSDSPTEVMYTDFVEKIDTIEKINIQEKGNTAVFSYVDKQGKKYKTTGPNTNELVVNLAKNNVQITGAIALTKFEWFIIWTVLTSGLFVGLNTYLRYKQNKKMIEKMNTMPQMPFSMQNLMKEKNVGKTVTTEVRLDDVAGCDEEKLEVMEIIEFLKNPKKYSEIGATIPKGVLLVGPPGTGKTLMAKAIAGEAGVHFIYASGSEFIEKYVGTGASRIREIFESAKKESPAILFIDEIDAIGKQRTGAEGSDERDQTLNQLLVEMDGMEENNGLIIIAATNRPEILDKAFLRKGRFDRKVAINLPDTKGREEILKVHAKKKRLAKSVSLREVAKKTNGFSGADIYAVLNEGALLAVRQNKKEIDMEDLDEAIDRVLMGHSSKSKHYSEKEKQMVATHESGHVVLGLKMSEADKIDKVTIVPRGNAGGYAMLTPKDERYLLTKENLTERICGLLGGRAAEELIFGQLTTGAHNDLEKATNIARSMVAEYGMSDLGIVQLEQGTKNYLGYSNISKNYSEKVAQEIDAEVKKILDNCYQMTKEVLVNNIELLKKLTYQLADKETLTAKEIHEIEISVRD